MTYFSYIINSSFNSQFLLICDWKTITNCSEGFEKENILKKSSSTHHIILQKFLICLLHLNKKDFLLSLIQLKFLKNRTSSYILEVKLFRNDFFKGSLIECCSKS